MSNEIVSVEDFKNQLGIDDWRQFKPRKMLPKVISMIPNANSEVIIESFKQFPELALQT